MNTCHVSRRNFLMGASGSLLMAGCATAPSGPPRDIGFELWSGVPGSTFGAPVNKTVRSRRISGPFNWTHPVTGQTTQVYRRDNQDPLISPT